MNRKERTILDRRSALSQKNIQFATSIACRDVLKRRQKVRILKTREELLEKTVLVRGTEK